MTRDYHSLYYGVSLGVDLEICLDAIACLSIVDANATLNIKIWVNKSADIFDNIG